MKKLLSLSIATLLSLSFTGIVAAQEETAPQTEQAQHQTTKHHATKKANKETHHQTKNHTAKKAKQHKKEAKHSAEKTTKQQNNAAMQHQNVEEPAANSQAE